MPGDLPVIETAATENVQVNDQPPGQPTPAVSNEQIVTRPGSQPITNSGTPTPAITLRAPILLLSAGDISHLKKLYEISFPPWNSVLSVAWSADSAWLAASAANQVYIYKMPEIAQSVTLDIGSSTPALSFSQDGKWLATGSRDGNVRLWLAGTLTGNEWAEQKKTSSLPGSAPAVSLEAIPPYWTFEAHQKGVNSLDFSPDSRFIATSGNDGVVRFWDLETGRQIGMVIGGTYAVPSVVYEPNGEMIALANGEYVRLRELATGRIWGTLRVDGWLSSLAYSPDGRLLAGGDVTNTIYLWDPAQAYSSGSKDYPEPLLLKEHLGRPGTFQSYIWEVAFSRDNSLLASAGGDGTMRIWDVSTGELMVTLEGGGQAMTCLSFSPDGYYLAAGSLDGVISLWGVIK